MSICDAVRDLLIAFEEGSALNCERELIERHLNECRACDKCWKELGSVRKTLDELPDVAPAGAYWEGFALKLRCRLDLAPRTEPRRILRPAAIAAMFVASVALAYFMGKRAPNVTPQVESAPVIQASEPTPSSQSFRSVLAQYLRDRLPVAASDNLVSEEAVQYVLARWSQQHPLLHGKLDYLTLASDGR